MSDTRESDILELAINNFRKTFGVTIDCKSPGCMEKCKTDAIVTIENIRFLVDVKSKVTLSNLNTIIDFFHKTSNENVYPLLLIAGELSESIMDKIFDAGVNVMDAAGNCRIKYDGLMMFCRGLKTEVRNKTAVLSFKGQSLNILYFVLSDLKNVNLTFREIQKETGAGLSAINKTFNVLRNTGYLFESVNGRFLKNTRQLLEIFVDNYVRVTKPKMRMTTMTFVGDGLSRWKEIDLPAQMSWGGEPAANLKDGYLSPEIFDIYTSTAFTKLIADKIAVPSSNGEIQVYRKFWSDSNQTTTPALIVYSDLMGSGDVRCIEAANRLYDKELSYLG